MTDAARVIPLRCPHAPPRTEEAGPFIYDLDADGRVHGIEILSASEVLAPGDWQNARRPGETKSDAAE